LIEGHFGELQRSISLSRPLSRSCASFFVIAPVVIGLIGLVAERLVVCHLYGRLVDTMLVTWGLSLFFIWVATMVFGTTTTGIATPIPARIRSTATTLSSSSLRSLRF